MVSCIELTFFIGGIIMEGNKESPAINDYRGFPFGVTSGIRTHDIQNHNLTL